MDPIQRFSIECEQEIQLQAENEEFANLSKQWIRKANELKYSYHFN